MNRREFLGVAAMSLAGTACGNALPSGSADKLARLSIMTYNFGNLLRILGQPEKPGQVLDLLDLPQVYVERYGIHKMEFQHSHLPIDNPPLLAQLQQRMSKVNATISQINLELQTINFSSPDVSQREQAVARTKQWIDRAAELGSPRLMINQGKLTREKMKDAIDALKQLVEYGESKKIKICMEDRARAPKGRDMNVAPVTYPPAVLTPEPKWVVNDATRVAWKHAMPHEFPIEPPRDYTPAGREWAPDAENTLLVELYKEAHAYSNIDVGGMCVDTQQGMNDGIKLMLPYNSGQVHINWRDTPGWDLAETIRFMKKQGFKGIYVIEARPTGDSYTVAEGLKEVILANM